MKRFLQNKIADKRVVILGYGREGASTYKLLRNYFPAMHLTIADKNETIREVFKQTTEPVTLVTGDDYLQQLMDFDVIIKSPGISLKDYPQVYTSNKITSQTDLFLQCYFAQTIGVTGTKGKSTTTSLIYHILKTAGRKAILCGNIGVPFFDIIPDITPETTIVAELSSHQLEFIERAPAIAVLLNLFQEHLDHYNSLADYHLAKVNIFKKQVTDHFIYHADDAMIVHYLTENPIKSIAHQFSLKPLFAKPIETNLKGEHNLLNIHAAAIAAMLRGVSADDCLHAISSFTALPHRMEYVGEYKGIHFYNDSIATIPEAAIQSVTALKVVDTLILGGFDRGIDYSPLVDFVTQSELKNLIFLGAAGMRICDAIVAKNIFLGKVIHVSTIAEAVRKAYELTRVGRICLLSPAAASYDQFKNFEERGDVYKKEIRSIG